MGAWTVRTIEGRKDRREKGNLIVYMGRWRLGKRQTQADEMPQTWRRHLHEEPHRAFQWSFTRDTAQAAIVDYRAKGGKMRRDGSSWLSKEAKSTSDG